MGDVTAQVNSIRLTYDGWGISVGPADIVSRLAERNFCPIAGIATAATEIGELFADFAAISVTATRRHVSLSLWRPDVPIEHSDWCGHQISELPSSIGVFGLGHLGQAYLWGLTALQYQTRNDVTIWLCDDDCVEPANIETGALLTSDAINKLKTRVVAAWLEARGFSTRLIERRVDEFYRPTIEEPLITLSGFDDNSPRQWLAKADFRLIFDSGLGGEAHNFDTIAFHAWPSSRDPSEIWFLESTNEIQQKEEKRKKEINNNPAYRSLSADECGRLLLAGKSIAVPFVGAMASAVVLAEMLKQINGGPCFSDIKLRLCSNDFDPRKCILACESAPPIRGLPTQAIKDSR